MPIRESWALQPVVDDSAEQAETAEVESADAEEEPVASEARVVGGNHR